MSTRPVEDTAPAWARRRVAVFRGLFDSNIATGAEYETQPLAAFFSMEPWNKAKASGPAFVPSTYHDHDAREHTAQRDRGSFVALTGDIDSGNHDLDAVFDAVEAFAGKSAWLIYSSPHARPGDLRWRIIIPLAEPQPFAAWYDAQCAFFAFMEARGLDMDHALARAAQPVFLPNVPLEHAKTGAPLRGEDGLPLHYVTMSTDITAPGLPLDTGPAGEGIAAIRHKRLEDERIRERIRREAEARRASKPLGDGASLMEDFNAGNSVVTMLEMCGYEQSPQHPEDWRSRYQTGETYATRVVGSKWISLSQSDVTNGVGTTFKEGCFGDAYDLYVHYKHGGDHKAAYRALGQERRAENVIYLPQAEPPAWMNEAPSYDEMPEWTAEEDQAVPPHEAGAASHSPDLLPVIDFAKWDGLIPPARRFAWGEWLPLGVTTMLTAPGGTGKSLFEQMLCTCVALGVPFLGMPTEQMNTLYTTCEDDEEELWRRQVAICNVLGVPISALSGRLYLVSLCGAAGTELAIFDEADRLVETDRWKQLVATCVTHNIRLYAFDNATDAMGGDLNDIHQVASFINLLTGLALQMDGAAMIVHHPNKAGDDWLGSIAWHNKVRSRWTMKRSDIDGDHDGRVLENPKANYGASGGTLNFRWFEGGFIRDEDLPQDTYQQMQETIRASSDNKLFLTCLAERNRQRRSVSDSKYGQNYACREFELMPESKRIGKVRLEAAMDRLFRINAIERGYLWVLKGEGKPVFGLREIGKAVPDRDPAAPDTSGEATADGSNDLPETSKQPSAKFRKPSDNLGQISDNLPETPSETSR
jgi:RecA-family ATPase